ncbi:MAG: DUF3891 family protein [Planctomycetota bacterium]
MIRRSFPLRADTPTEWRLIAQREHARLSHELAAAWGGPHVPPLVCGPRGAGNPLAEARRQLLVAVRRHDDGWAEWWEEPGFDREEGRPFAFTEMPPADAQRLWSASIDACREEGTLAGWVAASHFSWLQSKRDADWPEWRAWVDRVDAKRAGWLDEWLAASPAHTRPVADRALAWLQALDWMSLWLCCKAPAEGEPIGEAAPLVIGGEADPWGTGWPAVTFTPTGEGAVAVDPWPFSAESLQLAAETLAVPAARYAHASEMREAGRAESLVWRLSPCG